MSRTLILASTLGAALPLAAGCAKAPPAPPVPDAPAAPAPLRFAYPAAALGPQVDDYFGTAVADPYRWLESPDAPDTRAWVEAEAALTRGYLDALPSRAAREARLTELWNYERYSTPWMEGGQVFFYKNDGLQAQSVLYTATALDAPPRVLLDPNTLSTDGTVSLADAVVSWDGKLLAWGTSDGGSDWRTFRVRRVDTGADLTDELKWIKFSSVAWSKDNTGFYYSRYPEPQNPLEQVNENMQLYYHVLGEPQSKDRLVFAEPTHPKRGMGAEVSKDGKLLWIAVWEGTENKNRLYYQRLDQKNAPIVRLLDGFDAAYSVLHKQGDLVWLQTNLDAPRERIIQIDLRKPDRKNWKTIVPEQAEVLTGASVVGGKIIATYLKDARSEVRLFALDGKDAGTLALPGIGTVGGFRGEADAPETFYAFSSYTAPPILFRYDVSTGQSTVWKESKVPFDREAFLTEQVFVPSKDGTKIPAFIVRRKDTTPNGHNPTLLYGYGGFNISLTPSFSPTTIAWIEQGGVYVVANLRGGGEYGEAWHDQGIKLKKQNVFDDFIATAEYLVANQWTAPGRLGIQGGSNGGLLVGAAITQRPDLFGAAIPAVGVLDMLRYHLFTIGWAWASDYGRSDDSAEMFRYLYGYSPLHNVKSGTRYPSTLVVTADHDDRVVPAHSFKFAAALQAAHGGENPVLIRIEQRAGHGAGKSTAQRIEEAADIMSFLDANLGVAPLQPAPVFSRAAAPPAPAPASAPPAP